MLNFLKNILKWRISVKSNIIYIQRDKKMYVHTCEQCKKGYWDLPNHKNKKYVYKFTDDNFNIDFQEKIENEDFKVYGWIIQERYLRKNGEFTGWMDAWNHKLYLSKVVALDALNQMNKSYNRFYKYEFKVKPVYHLDDIASRNLLITEILKK